MSPLYTDTMVGTDFPVWIASENFEGKGELCLSLKEILTRCLNQIAPEESDAYILKENIDRIVHIANKQFENKKPQFFQVAIIQILTKLEKQLDVSGDALESFNKSLDDLIKALPKNGVLLPYSNNTSFQILEAAMVATLGSGEKNLKV